MNEQLAAYRSAKISFLATVPLPFVGGAIKEMTHALDTLSASGIQLFSNREAIYLGNETFTPFFAAVDQRKEKTIFFTHPSNPLMNIGGDLIIANPTSLPCGITEF